jgi:hypothetical protein
MLQAKLCCRAPPLRLVLLSLFVLVLVVCILNFGNIRDAALAVASRHAAEHGDHSSLTLERRHVTRFFVQVVTTQLIAKQLDNLAHFVSDAFEYHIVDASSGPNISAVFRTLVDRDNTRVFHHRCPKSSLEQCMNFATTRFVSQFTSGFAIHLNVDMFLTKKWNTSAYFAQHANPDVMAVIEDHASLDGQPLLGYLHPNLFMINSNTVNAQLVDLRFDMEPGADSGGATRAFFERNPAIRLKPLMWSRHFEIPALYETGLISQEVRDLMLSEQSVRGHMAADLYTSEFSWFHMRDSSCWSGVAACEARSKHLRTSVWPLLNAPFEGRNLTYKSLAYDRRSWAALNLYHQGSCTSGDPIVPPSRGDVSAEGFLLRFPPSGCLQNETLEARVACQSRKNIVLPVAAAVEAPTANSSAWI